MKLFRASYSIYCMNNFRTSSNRRWACRYFITPDLQQSCRWRISKRLGFIGCDDISNDLYLTTAAKLLTFQVIHHIEIGRAKMFMICNECSGHRVCQKQVNNSDVCCTCQKRISVDRTVGMVPLVEPIFN